MKPSYLFLAPGFEEIEAVAPVDVMRRAGMEVITVSILEDNPVVVGTNGVPYVADTTLDELPDSPEADWLILPGGMPGATNLLQCERMAAMLKAHQGNLAAICASPAVVFGELGLLNGKKATCYPGMETEGAGIAWTGAHVERDGRIITGQGPAWAVAFGAAIVEATLGAEAADRVLSGMLCK